MPHDRKLDYLELFGGDLAATKQFYGGAFGWSFVDYGPEYAAFTGAGLDGGFQTQAAAPPLPILYADDLAATVERVRKAGGAIVREIYSFPGGRRFHFRDPSGNELAVWSDKN
jgi:predicted enzyme related to lactoylglutathione lyase